MTARFSADVGQQQNEQPRPRLLLTLVSSFPASSHITRSEDGVKRILRAVSPWHFQELAFFYKTKDSMRIGHFATLPTAHQSTRHLRMRKNRRSQEVIGRSRLPRHWPRNNYLLDPVIGHCQGSINRHCCAVIRPPPMADTAVCLSVCLSSSLPSHHRACGQSYQHQAIMSRARPPRGLPDRQPSLEGDTVKPPDVAGVASLAARRPMMTSV